MNELIRMMNAFAVRMGILIYIFHRMSRHSLQSFYYLPLIFCMIHDIFSVNSYFMIIYKMVYSQYD